MRVRDPKAMRALAHRLRFDLIELLGVHRQATAAECARQLDTSQASRSFHLRRPATYGFAEEAGSPDGDQRKRPWRLTDPEQSWSTAEPPVAAREPGRVSVERGTGRLPDAWRAASFLSGLTAPLTTDELADPHRRLQDVLQPYEQRAGAPHPFPPTPAGRDCSSPARPRHRPAHAARRNEAADAGPDTDR